MLASTKASYKNVSPPGSSRGMGPPPKICGREFDMFQTDCGTIIEASEARFVKLL